MVRGRAEWKALFAGCGVNAQWTVNCSRLLRVWTTFHRKVVGVYDLFLPVAHLSSTGNRSESERQSRIPAQPPLLQMVIFIYFLIS